MAAYRRKWIGKILDLYAGSRTRLVFVRPPRGVRRLVVAGGETAGAVVNALEIPAVEITAIIDPGVPALRSLGDPPLELVLKSGNFGSPDFFAKAIRHLARE